MKVDRVRQSYRETFHWRSNEPRWGEDVDLAGAWLERGWNVGIFYWAPLYALCLFRERRGYVFG